MQEKEARSHWQQVPQQMCKLETTQKNLQIQEIQKAPQHILKQKTPPQILRRRFYFIKTLQAKSRKVINQCLELHLRPL